MASRYQIQMDFNRAKQKAQDLDNIANDLSRLSGTDLRNTLDGLSHDWKGDNANKYIQKGYTLKNSMDNTVKNLRNVASTIRTIAQNIYNAEMEALRIAEEREAAARAAAERAAAERAAAERAAAAGSSGRGYTGGGSRRR